MWSKNRTAFFMAFLLGRRGASRPLVGVVVQLADDRGRARCPGGQVVTAVPVAAQLPRLAQRVERAGDLAAVFAAQRLHTAGIEHRPGLKRLLDRLEARRALEHLRRAAGHGDLTLAPQRPRAIESGLRAGAPAVG